MRLFSVVFMRIFFLLLPVFFLGGCASYYTHYAMFPAENSSGEARQIRVSWQTADYPDWWFLGDKSTVMKVETQCSDRVWRLSDDSHEQAGSCAEGIRACGDVNLDVQASTGSVAGEDVVCMEVAGPEGVDRIADIGGMFSLLVSCRPAATDLRKGDDTVHMDYLRPSVAAYSVYARKVPRGTLNARLPEFDQSECKEN
ncbi:hypothetical protein [Marinobacter sp.]|uniref:hypothetical protein n=1 Tax=Marinobacter sp. TaxID=50741 RepID=UPI00356B617D